MISRACRLRNPKPVSFHVSHQSFADSEERYGIRMEKSAEIFPTDRSSEEFLPRRTDYNYYHSPGWISTGGCRTKEEIEQRQEYENVEKMTHAREKLAKYFMEKYKCYSRDQLEVYLKFAQRMKDNTEALERACQQT